MVLDSLRSWLINICTAVFFITAVEMILPDNSMKKYSKFVLGLILITVFINPIINIFNKDFSMSSYSTKVFDSFDEKQNLEDIESYKEKNLNQTLDTFKLNLEKNCQQKLKEKYPNGSYEVQANVEYDDKNNNVNINSVYVTVSDKSINRVKKVTIDGEEDNSDSGEDMDGNMGKSIKSYLSSQLGISEDIVHIKKG
ncbi:stage III sporulation protein AF [Clostridium sp. LBM24168]